MTVKEAVKLLEFWKKELRRQDWSVSVQIVPALSGRYGESAVTPETRTALITLTEDDPDPESTLVHELSHTYLPLHRFKRGSWEYVAAEQFIDLFADMAVRSRREKKQ